MSEEFQIYVRGYRDDSHLKTNHLYQFPLPISARCLDRRFPLIKDNKLTKPNYRQDKRQKELEKKKKQEEKRKRKQNSEKTEADANSLPEIETS